jgi:hypothetical protein
MIQHWLCWRLKLYIRNQNVSINLHHIPTLKIHSTETINFSRNSISLYFLNFFKQEGVQTGTGSGPENFLIIRIRIPKLNIQEGKNCQKKRNVMFLTARCSVWGAEGSPGIWKSFMKGEEDAKNLLTDQNSDHYSPKSLNTDSINLQMQHPNGPSNFVYVPHIPVLEYGSCSFPSSRHGSRPKQWTGFMNKGGYLSIKKNGGSKK